MKYTNEKMDLMLQTLGPVLRCRNLIGYAAARNARILNNELCEYLRIRDELIEKYGEPVLDQNGNNIGPTAIGPNSPQFGKFIEELSEFKDLEHEVELYLISYPDGEAAEQLSGEELLAIDWMFQD